MLNKMNPLTSIVFTLVALSLYYRGVNTLTTRRIISKIPTVRVIEAIQYGVKQMDMLSRLEYSLASANITVHIGSSSFEQFIDSKPSMETHLESRNAEIIIKATMHIANQFHLYYGNDSLPALVQFLPGLGLNYTHMSGMCLYNKFKESMCLTRNLKYRSSDGSCNNLKNPYWGKSNTAYRRNIYPAYKDGIGEMNSLLPSPRELSNSLAENKYYVDARRTMAVGIWALFIGYDMSHTAVSLAGATNKSIECCNANGSPLSPRHMHPLCAPIKIPKNDPFYQPLGRTCMNYVRSALTLRTNCTFGPREQVNQATHYLDGSMIYGTSYREMKSLRKNSGGLMLTDSPSPNITVLPVSNDPSLCHTLNKCYRSGDSRVNSHPYLLALYTVWVKEHNRIASELAVINPHWNDDTLFQETRRIIIAMIQHITYNEWLPIILSDSGTDHFITPFFSLAGSIGNYTDTCETATSNVFGNVIVPMAYSTFGQFILLNDNDQPKSTVYKMVKYYNKKPYETLKSHFDTLLRDLVSQKTELIDLFFTNHVTNQLYENNGFGMDIVSLSIQRGRDHGIPYYTQFRRYCGLAKITSEEDLPKVFNETIVRKLMRIYKHFDDIDLIVGVLLEKPIKGSMVGPTMLCILQDQLENVRMGDRYFYDLPGVFTQNQLAEIKKVTLSRLLCSNSNTIKKVQLNAFKTTDPNNNAEMLNCDSTSIPKMNLQHWEEFIDSNFK